MRHGGIRDRVDDIAGRSVGVMNAVGAVGSGHANVWGGLAAGIGNVGEAAGTARHDGNGRGRGHVHGEAGGGHGAAPAILLDDAGPVVDFSPGGWRGSDGVGGGMCGNVAVGGSLGVLFLLLSELCVVLLGLLAALSEIRKYGHGEIKCGSDTRWRGLCGSLLNKSGLPTLHTVRIKWSRTADI